MKNAKLREKIARLEEKLLASEKALFIAVSNEKLAGRISILENVNEHGTGKKEGSDKTWAVVVVIIGLIFGLIELILRLRS